jgi:GNAT superfamily N-acetyltransferase
MEIGIRPLANADNKALVDLVLNIQQIEFNLPITLKDQPDLLDIEKYYRGSGGDIWGAFAGDRLVGSIAIVSIGHQAGAVRKVFVQKEYRGGQWGIAQRLLEILIADCRRRRITDLYLGTHEILKAAGRFYEKNGFARINKADLPPWFPLMEVDNVFYQLHLLNEHL